MSNEHYFSRDSPRETWARSSFATTTTKLSVQEGVHGQSEYGMGYRGIQITETNRRGDHGTTKV